MPFSAFERDGYVVLRDEVDPPTVARARDHLAELQAAQPDSPIVTAPIEADPFFAHIVESVELVAIATGVLEAPVVAFGATYLVKPPWVGLPALWHQDGYPWREKLGDAAAVTLWIALDAATIANGCLRVIPGSHHEPAQPLRPNTEAPSLFGVEIDPAAVDVSAAVPVELAPGDVSAHHPNLIHGSDANVSEHPRRALAVRYRTR